MKNNVSEIRVTPIITEKSLANAKNRNFTFAVSDKVHKPAIKREIERLFSVSVTAIATSIVKGKKRRTGNRRIEIEGKSWKKVLVKLEEGQTISVFGISGK